jgi:hypothetical protein
VRLTIQSISQLLELWPCAREQAKLLAGADLARGRGPAGARATTQRAGIDSLAARYFMRARDVPWPRASFPFFFLFLYFFFKK